MQLTKVTHLTQLAELLRAIQAWVESSPDSVCACVQEPDSYGIRWEPTASRPGYGDLMLSLMDALYPILPGSLFFIEGSAQDCELLLYTLMI